MGLTTRFIRVLKAKVNAVLTANEDPIEQLDLAYQELQDKRNNVRTSIVDVIAQRKRLESKAEALRDEVTEHNRQAEQAMEQGKEDLARTALEKKKAKMNALESLEPQVDQLKELEEDMEAELDTIEERLSELETEKEVLKARYEGAEAIEKVNESLTEGVGDFSIEDAVADVEEDVEQMEARAEAIQEFDDGREESVEDQLAELTTDAEVEEELETLKARA